MAIKVTTYNVGQGLFNLLIETDSEGNHFCGLFDCGTIAAAYENSPEDILENASERIKQIGHLDFIVISHQDEDHWNLLIKLLCKIYPTDLERKRYIIDDKLVKVSTDSKIIETEIMKEESYQLMHVDFSYKSTLRVKREEEKICYDYKIKGNDTEELEDDIPCFSVYVEKSGRTYNRNSLIISPYSEIDYVPPIYGVDLEEEDLKRIILTQIDYAPFWYNITNKAVKKRFKYLWEKKDEIDHFEEYKSDAIDRSVYDTEIYLGGSKRSFGYLRLEETLQLFGNVNVIENGILYLMHGNFLAHDKVALVDISEYEEQSLNQRAIMRNATSLMAVYKSIDQKFFFPGDATIQTFNALNAIKKDFLYLDYMTAPHHGSRKTNIAMDEKGIMESQQPVKQFVKKHQPSIVVFSAKHNKFGHPDKKVHSIIYGLDFLDKHKIIQCNDRKSFSIDEIYYGTITTETTGTCVYPQPLFEFGSEKEVKTLQKKEIPSDKYFL